MHGLLLTSWDVPLRLFICFDQPPMTMGKVAGGLLWFREEQEEVGSRSCSSDHPELVHTFEELPTHKPGNGLSSYGAGPLPELVQEPKRSSPIIFAP